jgi:glutamate/tyrosine decarboxylase-like PLP-dependent enzyme
MDPKVYDNDLLLKEKIEMKISEAIREKRLSTENARYPVKIGTKELIEKHGNISYDGMDGNEVINNLVEDFFQGTPIWSSPLWSYNVGTATNIYAAKMYALALEENVYLINDGLAGNLTYIEDTLSKIIGKLADVEDPKCIFTFGGTGTNLYGIKLGISKSIPEYILEGLTGNVKIVMAQEAHYAQLSSADWLGVGTRNAIKIPEKGIYSDLNRAEEIMRNIIEKKEILGAVVVNGGTTYDHAIDDIQGFRNLIDNLVKEYNLDYTPHLHVDSVIGWSWLFFSKYNFHSNPLGIPDDYLSKIEEQYKRISCIKYADSWGIDFHKGVGGCPAVSSMVCINNRDNVKFLSKKLYDGMNPHHISPEFSLSNPSEFTLETTRSAGAPLAALTTLQTLGYEGYIKLLSNLLVCAFLLREKLNEMPLIRVCNMDSLGFCTVVRVYPDEKSKNRAVENEINPNTEEMLAEIKRVNQFNREFFEWDKDSRISNKNEFEYSYSTGYRQYNSDLSLEVLKFYNVSPRYSVQDVEKICHTISKQLETFLKDFNNNILN